MGNTALRSSTYRLLLLRPKKGRGKLTCFWIRMSMAQADRMEAPDWEVRHYAHLIRTALCKASVEGKLPEGDYQAQFLTRNEACYDEVLAYFIDRKNKGKPIASRIISLSP